MNFMRIVVITACIIGGCAGLVWLFALFTRQETPNGEPAGEPPVELSSGVKRIAWGYLLIYLNVNLGTLNILPNWLGYCFFLWALPTIAKEESSAALLRPLGILLAVWEGVLWAFGVETSSYLVGMVTAVLSLYFHFQLLTNLANIAQKYGCPQEKRLLTLRTVQTVLTTLVALPLPWQEQEALTIGIVLVQVVIALWLCAVLFSLQGSFRDRTNEI